MLLFKKKPDKVKSNFFILLLMLTISSATLFAVKKAVDESASFRLPVWIQTSGTTPPRMASLNEFKILQGKSPVEVTSLATPAAPTQLFIAFDTVGDVANITEARNALIREIGALGKQYRVGILSANEQVTVIQEPTASRELLAQKINGMSQIGKAGLLDNLIPVADLATAVLLHTKVRVAVIFITDSDIANYKTDYTNAPVNASDSRDLSRRFAGRALQEKITRMSKGIARFQVPIFVVHITPGEDTLNRNYQNGLKQLAEIGGGRCFLSKSIGDVSSTIHEAFAWVQGFYLIGFQLTGAKGSYANIEINWAPKETTPGETFRLIHPNKVFIP
ncbi:MAG: hypothetical protein U0V70_06440 [Terriglobia bacterium]